MGAGRLGGVGRGEWCITWELIGRLAPLSSQIRLRFFTVGVCTKYKLQLYIFFLCDSLSFNYTSIQRQQLPRTSTAKSWPLIASETTHLPISDPIRSRSPDKHANPCETSALRALKTAALPSLCPDPNVFSRIGSPLIRPAAVTMP